jgi:hypothetical protein
MKNNINWLQPLEYLNGRCQLTFFLSNPEIDQQLQTEMLKKNAGQMLYETTELDGKTQLILQNKMPAA